MAWIANPSKEQWAEIDAKSGHLPDKGDSDEEKSDNHVADAKKAASMGMHSEAMQHMARASTLTKDAGKQAAINSTAKKMAGLAIQQGKGHQWNLNLSNVMLADGPEPYHRGSDETVECPSCHKYNAPDARFCDQCGKRLPDTAYLSTPSSETTAGRKAAFKQGLALPPASPGGAPGFPIKDAAHWDKALQAVGRTGGGARRAALAKLLRKTAPMFGRTAKLNSSWAAPSGAAMSNGVRMSANGYDLAARYHSLQQRGVIGLAMTGDDGDRTHISGMESGKDDNETMDGVTCGVCEALNNNAARYCAQCGTPIPGSHDTNDANGVTLDRQPMDLRTPALGTPKTAGFQPQSAGIVLRDNASGSFGAAGSANLNPRFPSRPSTSAAGSRGFSSGQGRSIQLSRRMTVTTASDIVIARGPGGAAIIRHRRGGTPIGQILHNPDGTWGGQVDGGPELAPHTHQRAALQELIGTYNRGTTTEYRPALPLQAPPQQTELMARYGVPAIRALANDGDSDDNEGGSSGSGPAGLTPRGLTIYKKLIAKGFPPARALAFARNSQNKTGGTFKKAS